jgi:hypothetical protein
MSQDDSTIGGRLRYAADSAPQLLHPQFRSMARPTQAVILAGGRSFRLRPLTDIRPKPGWCATS